MNNSAKSHSGFETPTWIEVFRTGTWTDASGKEKEWTEEDLDAIASSYNPSEHEAPITIGHPKDNAPAYGWVQALKREGSVLLASIKPTVHEFVDWVRSGLYKKVSVALYGDGTLRHIGFLGGSPPAVKGLKMPEFTDSEFSEYEFDQKMESDRPVLSLEFIERSKEMPDLRVEKINSQEEMMEKKIDELEEKVKTLTAQLSEYSEANKKKDTEISELRAELNKTKADLRRAEYEAFCDDLMDEGRLLPKQKGLVINFMEILENTGEYEFSEGGKKPALRTFQEFLSSLPKSIEFGEIATKGKARPSGTEDKREELISEYMERTKADYKEAVLAVSKKHPELFIQS